MHPEITSRHADIEREPGLESVLPLLSSPQSWWMKGPPRDPVVGMRHILGTELWSGSRHFMMRFALNDQTYADAVAGAPEAVKALSMSYETMP